MLTFDDVTDRTPVTVDGVDYLIILAVDRPGRRELIVYDHDFAQVAGLASYSQPDVYEVTQPMADTVVGVGNDVAEAIRWLTLEDRM